MSDDNLWFLRHMDIYDEAEKDPDSAMFVAALHNEPEKLKAALEAGADVHWEQDYALVGAARKSSLHAILILLRAGANITVLDDIEHELGNRVCMMIKDWKMGKLR